MTPTTTGKRISIVVKTGRRMQISGRVMTMKAEGRMLNVRER
jgi:hypothetical protein